MARFNIDGLQPVIDDMRRLGAECSEAAEAMILTGAEVVRQAWQRSAEEHGLRDTGAMIASIGYPRHARDIGGQLAIDIYPQGKDARGVRNAEKAFIAHYGTSTHAATYWVDDADRYCDPAVVEAMAAIWEEYIATGVVPTVSIPAGVGSGATGITKT